MKLPNWMVPGLFSALCVAVVIGSLALAQEKAKKDKPKEAAPKAAANAEQAGGPSAAELQAFLAASTPGKMHTWLTSGKGEWSGKSTMWMAPGAEPQVSESTSVVTPILDGRFVRVEVKGEIPGMGPFHGIGVYGYDNVAKKFISTWIDNHGTGMMRGEGELSKDEKTLTWNCNFNCPLTQKPEVMKQVETIISDKERKLEMWGADPKTGKEYKMMQIDMKRK